MRKIGIYLFFIISFIFTYFLFNKSTFTQKAFTPQTPKSYGYINSASVSLAKGEIFNFSLLDQNGKYTELYRFKKYKFITIIAINPVRNNLEFITKLDRVINNNQNAITKYFFIYPGEELSRNMIMKFGTSNQILTPILLDP